MVYSVSSGIEWCIVLVVVYSVSGIKLCIVLVFDKMIYV